MTSKANPFRHLIDQGFTLVAVWLTTMPCDLANPHSVLVTQRFLKAFLDREKDFRTDGWHFKWREGWGAVFCHVSDRNAGLRALKSILTEADFTPYVSIAYFDFDEHVWRTFVPFGRTDGIPFEILYGPDLESGFSDELMRDMAARERQEQEGRDQA